MTYRTTRKYFVISGAIICLLLTGCTHQSYKEFDYNLTSVEARQLFEPMVMGQDALLSKLGKAESSPVIFTISANGVTRLENDSGDHDYWEEDKIVFLGSGTEVADSKWLYLNPRKLELEPLLSRNNVDSDLVITGMDTFHVFRVVPVGGRLPLAKKRLNLFRYDFELTEDNDITVRDYYQLTYDLDTDLAPTPLPDIERLLYLHKESDDFCRLMITDYAGNDPVPLFGEQVCDIRHPRLLVDGRLVFGANKGEGFSLHQIDDIQDCVSSPPLSDEVSEEIDGPVSPLTGDAIEAFEYPFPDDDRESEKTVFSTVLEDGILKPVLLELPAEYDLAILCDLVQTHNPAVNERRLLLASALLEAKQVRLANWPLINLGFEIGSAEEIFYDLPEIVSGDTLSRNIVKGLLGFVQPLLDFERNSALSRAAVWNAEIASNVVENEINERISEVAELYFEAQYLRRRIELETELLEATQLRLEYYQKLRSVGEALRLQILAVKQVVEGIESEQAFNRDRLDFLKSRIREVCGLTESTSIELADERFNFEDYDLGPLQHFRDVAILNHPRIEAARSELSQAYYQRKAGTNIRPKANLSVMYDMSRLEYNRVENRTYPGVGQTISRTVEDKRIDETITWGVGAQIPTASFRARKLNRAQWDSYISALEMASDAQARRIKTGMEESYLDFHAAQRDYAAKRSSLDYYFEKLRIARLHHDFAPPGAPIILTRPLESGWLTEELIRTDPLAPVTSRFECLEAMKKTYKVEMDLGLRFAHLWREMGLSMRLPEESAPLEIREINLQKQSTWLWYTKEILESDASLDEFADLCKRLDIKRVYAYLYSDSSLLRDKQTAERMVVLINTCAQHDVEVWGLLGEPEWITDYDEMSFSAAIDEIIRFNSQFGDLEPRLGGLKLDLEPHSLPGWDTDPLERDRLNESYLSLLRLARIKLYDYLPVWIDCPLKFWRPEHAQFIDSVLENIDGLTLMNYFNQKNPINKWTTEVLSRTEKPVEIGVEFSRNAPGSDRLCDWSHGAVEDFRSDFINSYSEKSNFTGLAYHDFKGLKSYFSGEKNED